MVFTVDRVQQRLLGAEHNVDIPVPRRGGRRLQALSIEQIVDIPVPVEGLQCFRPGQGSASSSFSHSSVGVRDDENEQFHEFFALFPTGKKVRRSPGRWVSESPRTPAHGRRRLLQPTPRGATAEGFFIDDSAACGCGWTRASGSCLVRMSSVLSQVEMQILGSDMG